MYNRQVTNPLVIRTPMGGGRGYGPTHSQNIEKHFVGVPGLRVLVLHCRARIEAMYRALRRRRTPVLIIENKLLYRERGDAPLPGTSDVRNWRRVSRHGPAPQGEPDLTLVAFGRMSLLAERAAARLQDEEEIEVELIFPLRFRPSIRLRCLTRSQDRQAPGRGRRRRGFDLGREVIAAASITHRGAAPCAAGGSRRGLSRYPAPPCSNNRCCRVSKAS